MFLIAESLERGNPFAYLLLVMIFCPPIVIIIISIIEKLKKILDK